jgi:hypothetical protein
MERQVYSVTFNMELTADEIGSLYETERKGEGLDYNADTRTKVARLLVDSEGQTLLRKLRPVKPEKQKRPRNYGRVHYEKEHSKKNRVWRRMQLAGALKSPDYCYEKYHRLRRPGVEALHIWMNQKPRVMYHFGSNLWPVHGEGDMDSLSRSPQWRKSNKRQAEIEDFKASLSGRYPGLLDHTATFFQKPCYADPVHYSHLMLLSRSYTSPFYDRKRRFPEELLARFSRECLEHDLRVIVEDRPFRECEARFILIVESRVDLPQAYKFAIGLPNF